MNLTTDPQAIAADFDRGGMSAAEVADKYGITKEEAYGALERGRMARDVEREAREAARLPATLTELRDVSVGDVVRYGSRDYTVTRSEPTDRGRFWRITAVADDGADLDVVGVAPTQEWGQIGGGA
jgi:hypothetical protein